MSEPGLPAERTSVARPLILALLGLGALGAAGLFVLHLDRSAPAPPPVAVAPAPPPPMPPPMPPSGPAKPAAPGFDIVRIGPNGDAVLAGHAAPGAEVTVQDAGKPIGHVTADAGGDWVLIPPAPLAPGARAFTLTETLPDGTHVDGPGSVVAVVPEPATAAPPLAVLDQPGSAPRVLQAPPGDRNAKLALSAVDYDDHGQVRFAGTAPAGSAVRVYVDNHPVGDATVDAQGRWTLSPDAAIAPGQHRLRVDQLDRGGKVASRIELPFQREQLTAAQIGSNRVLVQPGESLWRLARETYGAGVRYTVIYQANQAQIRDPAKIYPGQLLAVPPEGAATAR